jgi:hypothetical protein
MHLHEICNTYTTRRNIYPSKLLDNFLISVETNQRWLSRTGACSAQLRLPTGSRNTHRQLLSQQRRSNNLHSRLALTVTT